MAVTYETIRGTDVIAQTDAVRGDYMLGKVAVVKTSPETVLEDYARLMRMLGYQRILPKENSTLLKINISWDRFYPACSTAPWQLEGVVKTMLEDGYHLQSLIPAQNRTVVVDAKKGAVANKHTNVAQKYGFGFVWLWEPQVEWVRYEPQAEMLALDKIFEEGITIPKLFIGKNALHLPTMKCVHPDTVVALADGSLQKIGELVEKQLGNGSIPLFESDGDVRVQARIPMLSLMPDGSIAPQETCWVWRTPVNGHKLWRVQTRTGREVTVSPEHPFLTPTGWKKASELQVGERVAIPRRLPVRGQSQPLPQPPKLNHDAIDIEAISFRDGRRFTAAVQKEIVHRYVMGEGSEELARAYNTDRVTIKHIVRRSGVDVRGPRKWRTSVPTYTSPNFWRWMGYFLAEGCVGVVNGRAYQFIWANRDPDLLNDYSSLTKELFGIVPKDYGTGEHFVFTSWALKELFGHLGLPIPLNAGNKRVPPLLFRCPDEEIIAFLSGYWDGDGTVSPDHLELRTKTKAFQLACGVRNLLLRLGVIGFIRQVANKVVDPRTERRLIRSYYDVMVSGEDAVRLLSCLSFRRGELKRRQKDLLKKRAGGPNWDAVPIPPDLFRSVRRRLGLTGDDMGKQVTVSDIERDICCPTRSTAKHFLVLFEKADAQGACKTELSTLKFLASDDIAWDHVTSVEAVEPNIPYLYDLTLDSTSNFVGNGLVLHNTHVFTGTTGALKNSFGGLLRENRHWCHAEIHQVLVDLLAIQREIHPGLLAVMDGSVSGKGPGPRAMEPVITNYLLASADQVAIDAIAAKMMGFDPMSLRFIRLAHERGLGVGDPQEIEVIGEEISGVNLHYQVGDTFASRGQKAIYHGFLKPFEKFLLRTPILQVWSFWASHLYHNVFFWTKTGSGRAKEFLEKTEWGRLFQRY